MTTDYVDTAIGRVFIRDAGGGRLRWESESPRLRELAEALVDPSEATEADGDARQWAVAHLAYYLTRRAHPGPEPEHPQVAESLSESELTRGIPQGERAGFIEFVICTNKQDCDSGELGGLTAEEVSRLKAEWRGLTDHRRFWWCHDVSSQACQIAGVSAVAESEAVNIGQTKQWIGVDLDGTLAEYDEFAGPTVIGKPVAAMLARVRGWLEDGRDVRILTARVSLVNGASNADDAYEAIKAWCRKHIGRELPITCSKDPGMTEQWDDRAIQVEPNTGRVLGKAAESEQEDPSYDSDHAEECCPHCGARQERGDDGNCNRCGKAWPLEVVEAWRLVNGVPRFIAEEWQESDHPRGQPGNAGQFASKGTGDRGKALEDSEKRVEELKPLVQAEVDKQHRIMDEMTELADKLGGFDKAKSDPEYKRLNATISQSYDAMRPLQEELNAKRQEVGILKLPHGTDSPEVEVAEGVNVRPEVAQALVDGLVSTRIGDESRWVAARYKYTLMKAKPDEGRYTFRIDAKNPIDALPDGKALEEIPNRDGYVYRGMSREEWEATKERGYLESMGSHNIGQEGLTFYGKADTAHYYATGFAPYAYQPAPGRPGVVVEIPRSKVKSAEDDPRIPGSEFAHEGRLPVSDITKQYDIFCTAFKPGEVEAIYSNGQVREGSRFSPSMRTVTVERKVIKAAESWNVVNGVPRFVLEAWDEEEHPRGQPGNPGQFVAKGAATQAEPFTLKPAEPRVKQPEISTIGGKQTALFDTRGLHGQMSLFAEPGVPPEMVNPELRVKKHEATAEPITRAPHAPIRFKTRDGQEWEWDGVYPTEAVGDTPRYAVTRVSDGAVGVLKDFGGAGWRINLASQPSYRSAAEGKGRNPVQAKLESESKREEQSRKGDAAGRAQALETVNAKFDAALTTVVMPQGIYGARGTPAHMNEEMDRKRDTTVQVARATLDKVVSRFGAKALEEISKANVTVYIDQVELQSQGVRETQGTVYGCYTSNPTTGVGRLHLTGVGIPDPEGTYSHEMTHAIDGPKDTYSSSRKWGNAWRAEIGSAKDQLIGVVNDGEKVTYRVGKPASEVKSGDRLYYGKELVEVVAAEVLTKGKFGKHLAITIRRTREDGSQFEEEHKWKTEIPFFTAESPMAPPETLSRYAQKNASEGFAEFGRLVVKDPDKAREMFPRCYKLWREWDLV